MTETSSSTSTSAVPTVVGGGGGQEYAASEEGPCGVVTLTVTPGGSGDFQIQVMISSTTGAILGGQVKVTWGGSGGSGTSPIYDPVAADGLWLSPTIDAHIDSGAALGATLDEGHTINESAGQCDFGSIGVTAYPPSS